jgi:hypothetical protein
MMPAIYVLDVEEFAPLVRDARAMGGVTVAGPAQGYFRISSPGEITFKRKSLGFKPAVWYGALTGGLVGRVAEFSRDTLRIVGE